MCFDFQAFKLFVLDVELFCAISGLDLKILLEGARIFEEFKGALTEQYVLQQLVASGKIVPFYWTAEKGTAEIDFIFQEGTDIIPLEVKAAENLRAKSLKSYCQKYQPKVAVRTSMSNYREEQWLLNMPLYAINMLLEIIRSKAGLRKR